MGGVIVGAMEVLPTTGSEGIDPVWKLSLSRRVESIGEASAESMRTIYKDIPPRDLERMIAPLTDAELERQCDTFVRSNNVAEVMSLSCPGMSIDDVRILRDRGYLIAVTDQGRSLYPMFQFDRGTGLLPHDLIRLANERFTTQDDSGWSVLSWWLNPTGTLRGIHQLLAYEEVQAGIEMCTMR